jgi:hypothetical protein
MPTATMVHVIENDKKVGRPKGSTKASKEALQEATAWVAKDAICKKQEGPLARCTIVDLIAEAVIKFDVHTPTPPYAPLLRKCLRAPIMF